MFKKNLFSEQMHKQYKDALMLSYPEFSEYEHGNFLSLIEYIEKTPCKYYDKSVVLGLSSFMNEIEPQWLEYFKEALTETHHELNLAIKGLEELNTKDIHEKELSESEVEQMYEIGNTFLYDYLKLNDLILLGLLKPFTYFQRKKKGKGLEKLDIYNCVETLKNEPSFSFVNSHYNHTLRNAIAHGGVEFSGKEIIFKDKKRQVSLTTNQFVQKFDSLLNVVNGLCFVFKRYFLLDSTKTNIGMLNIPQSIMEKELKVLSEHYGWKIIYTYENSVMNQRQFNLYVTTTLNSRDFMNFSAFQTAFFLERLMPKKFDRLNFQIKTKFRMPCWQFIDMNKLRNNLETGEQSVVSDGTFFFDEKFFSRKRDKLNLILNSFPKVYIKKPIHQIRYIKFHDKRYYNVIEKASLVLDCSQLISAKSYIKDNAEELLRACIKYKNEKSKLFSKQRIKPTKYIRLLIYSNNVRERTFARYSLDGDLIAIIQQNKTSKIRNILPNFGNKEAIGDYVICWSDNHPNLSSQIVAPPN